MPRPPATNPPGRDTLIASARRLFLERGYASVSMQQIAEEAGMTKGAPYYHFKSKQDLFITISVDILRDLFATAESAMAGDDPFAERVEQSLLQIALSISGDFSRWYTDLMGMAETCAADVAINVAFDATQMIDLIVPTFARAHAEGEFTRVTPDVAAFTWFMLLKVIIDHAAMEKKGKMFGDRPLSEIVHDLTDIYFHGIA